SQRIRQTHDIWHVLTGYRPDVPGEVALQAFSYAQTEAPGAALIALLGTVRWAAKAPGLARMTWDGYRRGRDAAFLAPVRWEDHWDRPLDDVRRELGIEPARAREVVKTSKDLAKS